MKPSLPSVYVDMMRLGWESSLVMGLRLMTLSGGGTKAMNEAQLMMVEKMQAATVVTVSSLFAIAGGTSSDVVARRAIAHYSRKVVANRRRLSRRA